MKIEKETLQRYRARLNPQDKRIFPTELDRNQQRQVVEFALELLDEAAGGPDIAKLRQELAEKENNLKAILTDINQALVLEADVWTKVEKAVFIVTTGLKYLRSSKTKDFQSWKDYRVMVDEEFSTS